MSYEDGKVTIGGRKYTIWTLDVETAYSDTYTLSGAMNTSEYVRDDQFKEHMWACKKGNEPAFWVAGKDIPALMESIDWENTALIGHNLAFDGLIISHHHGKVPAMYIDTLSMARAVHGHYTRHSLDVISKLHGFEGKVKSQNLTDIKGKWDLTDEEVTALGEYALDDVDLTYNIFWKMFPYMPDSEMQLVDLTIRMFCRPLLVTNNAVLQAFYEEEVGAKAQVLKTSGIPAEVLSSNNLFANHLRQCGIEPPVKMSLKTGKPAYAFSKQDKQFQELLNSRNDAVREACWARLRIKSTIGESRAMRLMEAGKDGMPLPVLLNYCGAHTTRWSAGNKMNFQNMTRGSALRKGIEAPPGYRIVVADSAQIEARMLAWLAGEEAVLDAFRNGEDVYIKQAAMQFGVLESSVTKEQRQVGKCCILGLGFGCGFKKFVDILRIMGKMNDVTLETSRKYVEGFRRSRQKTVELWERMEGAIAIMGLGGEMQIGPVTFGKNYARLPNGLFLHYYGVHGVPYFNAKGEPRLKEATFLNSIGRGKLYGGMLTENIVQALARVVVADQMLAMHHELGYPIVMMTHDEVALLVPEAEADDALARALDIMKRPPSWAPDLPLGADGDVAISYGDAK